jgi:hypothetical protein
MFYCRLEILVVFCETKCVDILGDLYVIGTVCGNVISCETYVVSDWSF